MPVTALRYHNIYGPRLPRDTPYAGVAALFASAIAAGRAPRVFEDGGQRRDFVHVRDVARANVLALTAADAGAGRVQRLLGPAAHDPRPGARRCTRALAPDGARRRSSPATSASATSATSSPTRRRAARRRSGFAAREDFAAGLAELGRELVAGMSRAGRVRGHVLVVDDEPTIAEVVCRYLERAGYATTSAGDGPDAVAAAATRRRST